MILIFGLSKSPIIDWSRCAVVTPRSSVPVPSSADLDDSDSEKQIATLDLLIEERRQMGLDQES